MTRQARPPPKDVWLVSPSDTAQGGTCYVLMKDRERPPFASSLVCQVLPPRPGSRPPAWEAESNSSFLLCNPDPQPRQPNPLHHQAAHLEAKQRSAPPKPPVPGTPGGCAATGQRDGPRGHWQDAEGSRVPGPGPACAALFHVMCRTRAALKA